MQMGTWSRWVVFFGFFFQWTSFAETLSIEKLLEKNSTPSRQEMMGFFTEHRGDSKVLFRLAESENSEVKKCLGEWLGEEGALTFFFENPRVADPQAEDLANKLIRDSDREVRFQALKGFLVFFTKKNLLRNPGDMYNVILRMRSSEDADPISLNGIISRLLTELAPNEPLFKLAETQYGRRAESPTFVCDTEEILRKRFSSDEYFRASLLNYLYFGTSPHLSDFSKKLYSKVVNTRLILQNLALYGSNWYWIPSSVVTTLVADLQEIVKGNSSDTPITEEEKLLALAVFQLIESKPFWESGKFSLDSDEIWLSFFRLADRFPQPIRVFLACRILYHWSFKFRSVPESSWKDLKLIPENALVVALEEIAKMLKSYPYAKDSVEGSGQQTGLFKQGVLFVLFSKFSALAETHPTDDFVSTMLGIANSKEILSRPGAPEQVYRLARKLSPQALMKTEMNWNLLVSQVILPVGFEDWYLRRMDQSRSQVPNASKSDLPGLISEYVGYRFSFEGLDFDKTARVPSWNSSIDHLPCHQNYLAHLFTQYYASEHPTFKALVPDFIICNAHQQIVNYVKNNMAQKTDDFMLHLLVDFLPTGSDSFVLRFRTLSDDIGGVDTNPGGLDPSFHPIKTEIHRRPTRAVVPKVENYLKEAIEQKKSDVIIEKTRLLVQNLRWAFNIDIFPEFHQTLQELGIPETKIKLFEPLKESTLQAIVAQAQNALDVGFQLLEGMHIKPHYLDELHAIAVIRSLLMGNTSDLVDKLEYGSPAPLYFSGIEVFFRSLQLEGLLTEKQTKGFLITLSHLQKEYERSPTEDLRRRLKGFLKYVGGAAQNKVNTLFLVPAQRFADLTPRALETIEQISLSRQIFPLGRFVHKLGEENLQYESFHTGRRKGILRIVRKPVDFDVVRPSIHDILVSATGLEVPKNISYAALLTTDLITIGSHQDVLAANLKRPVATVPHVLDNAALVGLEGKPVELNVDEDGYQISAIDPAIYQTALVSFQAPSTKLALDLTVKEPLVLPSADATISAVGGKASHYSEILKVLGDSTVQPAFAIPMGAYEEFLVATGLKPWISEWVSYLTQQAITYTPQQRALVLTRIREMIQKQSVSQTLLKLIRIRLGDLLKDSKVESNKESQKDSKVAFRFRSSGNGEDLEEFSAAGLFTSVSLVTKKDQEIPLKDIEGILKQVWSSLWTEEAFQAREEAGIDHLSASMAVLVHRSFEDEKAGGIILAGTNKDPSRIRIISNFGKISVTKPVANAVAEVLELSSQAITAPVLRLRKSNVKGGEPVLSDAEAYELVAIAEKLQNHFGKPQEIDFKIMGKKREVWIKQARPLHYD